MSDKNRIKRILFVAGLGVAAAGLLIAFSPEPARAQGAQAQAKDTAISSAALEAALHRALPGAVAAHTGTGGVGRVESGHMGSVRPARSVQMSALPQVIHPRNSEDGDHDRPLSGLTEPEYQALKKLAAQRAAAGEIGSKPSRNLPMANPLAAKPPSVGATKGFVAQSEVCCDPPDMALAVSENFVVQMVNNYVAVYSKSGVLQTGFPKDADTFFDLPAGTYTTDPRAFYDWDSHRFFIVELTETNTNNPNGTPNVGGIVWAVSQTHDPREGWYVYSNSGPEIGNGSGVCPDFPTLGHDTTNWGPGATKGGIYIGLNLWDGTDCGNSSFTTNIVYFLPKDALYSGGGFGYWEFNGFAVNGTMVDTLQPDNVTDRADKPSAIFLVHSYNYDWGNGVCSGGCNGLGVWSVSGPTTGSVVAPNNPFAFLQGGNGPVTSFVGISTTHNYSLPPSASEPGCTAANGPCVDTDYTFISGQIKYHAGEIFGSFNTGVAVSPAVAGPIWFDIHPIMSNSNSQLTSVTERQEDCFLCGGWVNNGSAYYATLQPDQENNVVMVFDYSTDAAYPGTVFTSRRVTYGDNLMDGGGAYLEGGAGKTSGRWGDYTATAPDLTVATEGLLWFSAQYSLSSGGWGTVIGAAEYSTAGNQ